MPRHFLGSRGPSSEFSESESRKRSLRLLPPEFLSQQFSQTRARASLLGAGAMLGVATLALSAAAKAIWNRISNDESVVPELDDPKGGIDQPEFVQGPEPAAGAPKTSTLSLPPELSKVSKEGIAPLGQLPSASELLRVPALPKLESAAPASTAIPVRPSTPAVVTPPSSSQTSTPLAKNYRTKVEFSGFPGAEGLSKYGSYTTAEADTIKRLRKDKVNTGATGSMPKSVADLIRFYAKKHGVDAEEAIRVAKMESGGNPNAISATGAIGIFQFTGQTATGMGITDRFDIHQNIEAGILLAKANTRGLVSAGLTNDAVSVYLAHQIGPAGAKEVLMGAKNKLKISELSARTQQAIAFNYGGNKANTAAEYVEITRQGLNRRDRAVAIVDDAAPTLAATSLKPTPNAVPVKQNLSPPTPSAEVSTPARPSSTASTGSLPAMSARSPEQPPQSVARTKNGLLVSVG